MKIGSVNSRRESVKGTMEGGRNVGRALAGNLPSRTDYRFNFGNLPIAVLFLPRAHNDDGEVFYFQHFCFPILFEFEPSIEQLPGSAFFPHHICLSFEKVPSLPLCGGALKKPEERLPLRYPRRGICRTFCLERLPHWLTNGRSNPFRRQATIHR